MLPYKVWRKGFKIEESEFVIDFSKLLKFIFHVGGGETGGAISIPPIPIRNGIGIGRIGIVTSLGIDIRI